MRCPNGFEFCVLVHLLHGVQVIAYLLPSQVTDLVSTQTSIIPLPTLPPIPSGAGSASDPILSNNTQAPYSLPQNASDPEARAAAIALMQANFLYGPAVAGGPFYPTGVLGEAKNTYDLEQLQLELNPELANTATDAVLATAGIASYDGLQTVEDYTRLYDNQWQLIIPKGPDPGELTNYTSDLLFSMERLSVSPYAVSRLNPSSDSLAFPVEDNIAVNITGMTLSQLFQDGRLFYVDFSNLSGFPSTGLYSGAVDAYFYIDPASEKFLPLAIHSNVGSKLVYTPMDTANDWLFAKMMYEVDDFWFAQWNHLAATHEVVQIAWLAAIRTLSVDHPVFGLLERLMYEVYAIQVLAATVLFAPGGAVDLLFPYTGSAAQQYSSDRYFNCGAGRVQPNYFLTDLQSRGLINSTFGPPLSSFPFYEDASVIHSAQQAFMTSFVNSYYSTDSVILGDDELQDWVNEAQGEAQAIDFPSLTTTTDLIDLLTHMAHLVSTSHHTVNTNELISASSTLPLHPPGLYAPLPTKKGIKNVVRFLPPFDKCVLQFTVASLFARPLLMNTNRTLLNQFNDQSMLQRMNGATQAAAGQFMSEMTKFAQVVGTRTFDADGLSQGMPFVWQALDPNFAPYSVTT